MHRSLAMLGLMGFIGVAIAMYVASKRPAVDPPVDEPTSNSSFPIPPFSESRFLNVGDDARYIGSVECAKCHLENHKSYLLTAHSRALSDIDPSAEPADATFEHVLSGRTYRVYRKDGKLRHEELIRTAEGKEIARVDHPLRYLIGSGNYSRSYLADVDGYLVESPLTWYTAKGQWGMSPGYDRASHLSFQRPTGVSCLWCHAGRLEPTDGSPHRVTFHEKAIGCENCHGPGSKHREFHLARKLEPGVQDFTIVHPGKLSRELGESICSACHLNGPATVDVRGRQITDYRPGRPLSDYRLNYKFDTEQVQMTVVGHVEQLRQSLCYQRSADLTCVTCHDMHAKTKPADPAAAFRQKCLNCHTTKPCGLPVDLRLKQNPADNCMSCHMPRSDTDIPHFAFTHHRIGKHAKSPAAPLANERIAELVLFDENPHLAAIDRERNLGLACIEVSRSPPSLEYARAYRKRGREHLESVYSQGLRDAELVFALAELSWTDRDVLRTRQYLNEALEAPGLRPDVRAECLTLLANCELELRNYPAASALLEQSVKLRRSGEDWRILGVSYLHRNLPDKALPAFQRSLSIRADRPSLHLGLSECFRRLGDAPREQDHLEKAQWIQRHLKE